MGKIIRLNQLHQERQRLTPKTTVVLVTGVFDLLHTEHRKFLQTAKNAGDILLVGIETDVRVRQLKGSKRPVQNQKQRLKSLASLVYVDYVFLLPRQLAQKKIREEFIRKLKPNIYAVSANSPFQEEKKRIITKYQGIFKVIYARHPEISTTKLIETAGR